nr:hypothetical protein [Tanacetum cinerariifolium]
MYNKNQIQSLLQELLEGCPWPGQILTAVGVDANDRIYPVTYAIVEVESKASWYCVRHIHENMKSQFKGGAYKEMLWNVAKDTSKGEFKKKIDELKSFNSDAYDWLIKIPLEQWSKAYFSEYLMKRIVEVQKVIAKTIGPLTPSVIKTLDAIKKATELETWVHVYSFKVNPCNGRDMWPVVESRTVIIPSLYKPLIGRPPKRGRSQMMRANQSASSGKLSRKGKLVSCGKCGNVGHNKKGCRGQGGGSSQVSARKVSGQAAGVTNVSGQADGARNVSDEATNVSGQAAGARKVSSQVAGATNVYGQAAGVRKVYGQAAGSRKVFGQAIDAKKALSQPSAAQST